MKKEDIKHLQWVYLRMRDMHQENENYDYMIKFREIIDTQSLSQPRITESVCDCISVIGSFEKDGIYYCKTCKNRKRKQPVR